MTQDSLRPVTDSTALIDTTVPHSARIWNYWLGGKDNYPVDHAAGDAFRAVFPGITDLARDSRAFLGRAVTHLAAEAGIRQFLDIGTGLPTADNTHEIAQRVAPRARVVYVDNDPLVLTHARALLTSTPEGATDYIESDLHDPETVLREAARTLDLSQPVGLTMMQVSGHIADYDEARSIIGALMAALPSGSYLAFNDSVDTNEANAEATRGYNESGAVPYYLRSPAELAGFFDGLELLAPGVVPLNDWRTDPTASGGSGEVIAVGGVARKP
ncbi:SAM-dependent methyltransferase [Streptomyces europaeiscabiei]|uniref:SAM-dependent methyltransferase n=1 Tax=Streptomyces europaeiscabiei TaxID=146819 RepID=UPI0029B9BA14|nr:SAM-dependent methyltransferase [Streptomyces europaeiscabiei]MDX2529835.1 SAM-dependent methyltransferase [Streptomyces europaeiscabiei]MDX2757529.1 SAM-dependent methyltransferase [Streptomyces europaeiscabiei]MDX2757562.1 SAM-dependent methyltransferase [Streptomyces europaeiscabiei]MDX3836185.1 SAM-dependent methyltransferase [Streptomyces europaeiscabiei]